MYMSKWLTLGVLLATVFATASGQHSYADDDEFGILDEPDEEAFVEDEMEAVPVSSKLEAPEEVAAEPLEEDFESETSHLHDEDEFEGFSKEESDEWERSRADGGEPKLKVAEVPAHLRSSWHSYPLELALLVGLAVYFANYLYGRNANAALAASWFAATRNILSQNFALVGDDGRAAALAAEPTSEGSPAPAAPPRPGKATYDILKESDSLYSIYCSGRLNVASMMVELKLLKRQDLLSLGMQVVRPGVDEAIVRIQLDSVEPVVMCVAARRYSAKYAKEMTDIMTYAGGERKAFLPAAHYGEASAKFSVWCELPEAASQLLTTPRVLAVLPKYLARLNYLHVSDQYSGVRLPDQDASAPVVRQQTQKVLVLSVQLTDDAECLRQTLQMALGLADRMATFRLSKEGKSKALRNRSRIEEAFVKSAHIQRSERAQEKREERIREEREKMLEIEDPEKQRRWEDKENKRLARKRVPKVKQMRVN